MNDDLIKAIEQSMLKQVKDMQFIDIHYSDRKPLPKELINKAWEAVDWDKVLKLATEKLETRICNCIITNMETEIKTDVKSLLSVDGVRQKLRLEVYPKLMAVLNEYKE